jgi:UDP-N-acetylmuramoyl-tripeptide--D-alanyl-D-alanine ligase
MTIEQLYDICLRHPSIQTDTRQLQPGDLFFALKGPNFNGNQFAAHALELGAAYAIIDEAPLQGAGDQVIPPKGTGDQLILVPDVLTTLQDLALHHRKQFNIPFIAITGSNGKTTTKELIHAVLSSTFTTYTTKGNLNNHIGIPLTILSVQKDARFAVIEMGANHQKEIEGYCAYTLPTHGIITNIGKAHLEGFGGPAGVRKGKGELYDFLRAHDGTAFVGFASEAPQPFLHVDITSGANTGTIKTQLVGDYNLPNVLVAVAVGKHFGIPDDRIRASIEAYTPSNSRSQLIEKDGLHIILDAYNANPSSMRAAIENFANLPIATPGHHPPDGSPGQTPPIATPDPNPTGTSLDHKVLILGAMAELGPESLAEHLGIIDLIARYPWQQVVLVGGDFRKLSHPYLSFANSKEAGHWLRGVGLQNAWLLIKGSRSMKMEEVLA